MYPAIKPQRLTGDEALIAPDGKEVGQLIDFWRWAYSDLVGNAERGALAEYIVACALGIRDSERISWDKYDLLTTEGICVEVKTSGYLQTWARKTLSKPAFGIRPTYGWDSQSNVFDTEQKRQADVYVFCVHKHTDQSTVNPLQISQWEFYVMATSILNERFGNQKTVTLAALQKAGAEKCGFYDLKDMIHRAI